MDARRQFGENLRNERDALGWTQEELALRSNIHLTQISRMENGHRNPGLEIIVKLADALGIPAADLLVDVGAYRERSH